MGWNFNWAFSLEYNFNHDFGVSFTPEEVEHKSDLPFTMARVWRHDEHD